MTDFEELLTIEAYGRLFGLTPSALRFYDDCGLLRPVRVDGASGYLDTRWFHAEQRWTGPPATVRP